MFEEIKKRETQARKRAIKSSKLFEKEWNSISRDMITEIKIQKPK